jgi:hypothetical protein
MIELNLQGLIYIAHAALPPLLRAAEREPRRVADLVNISSVAGRRVGAGGGVYQLTKHGVGTFSEALRQEVTARHVRSSLIEPGATESELVSHVREQVRSQMPPSNTQILAAEDIADAILYIVMRPRHVATTRSWFALRNRSASARQPLELGRRRPRPNLPDSAPVVCVPRSRCMECYEEGLPAGQCGRLNLSPARGRPCRGVCRHRLVLSACGVVRAQ